MTEFVETSNVSKNLLLGALGGVLIAGYANLPSYDHSITTPHSYPYVDPYHLQLTDNELDRAITASESLSLEDLADLSHMGISL